MNSTQFAKILPFDVDINIYPPFEDMRLQVVAKSKQPGQNLELLSEVLFYFVSSANAGMFSSQPYSPEQAFMQIVSSNDTSKGEIKCIWESRYIKPGAYKILLRMVAQSHHGHVPLSFFELSSLSKLGTPMHLEEVAASNYPERVIKTPFELDLAGDLDIVTMPAIRMEFIRGLDSDEFQKVEQLIADWHTLILLGGYLDSYEALKELPMHPGKTYLASSNTVEHVLYGFTGPSVVYDAIINMAVKLHFTFCPLSRMEIE
jgi:hypothetical protein